MTPLVEPPLTQGLGLVVRRCPLPHRNQPIQPPRKPGRPARSPARRFVSPTALHRLPGDQITSYGNPTGVGTPLVVTNNSLGQQLANNSSASRVRPRLRPWPRTTDGAQSSRRSNRTAKQPSHFARRSLTRLPTSTARPRPQFDAATAASTIVRRTAPTQSAPQLPPGINAKHVGSRTFALEYDLEDFGRSGIAKVELWGTRDGGQTWRLFATDDDHRSPLVATVDDAGVYGFRIVVESAGGAPAIPPGPGDAPELWVDVDLQPADGRTHVGSTRHRQSGRSSDPQLAG